MNDTNAEGRNVGLSAGLDAPLPKVYTISRCTIRDDLYGPKHWSADAITTFCGQDLNAGAWWILSSDFSGEATCKKCIRASNAELSDGGTPSA